MDKDIQEMYDELLKEGNVSIKPSGIEFKEPHYEAYKKAMEVLGIEDAECSSSIPQTNDDIMKERGDRYGKYEWQRYAVGNIVHAMETVYIMKNNGAFPSASLKADWYYMAIKIARIAASPDYEDNYIDLENYVLLARNENCK